MQTSGRAAAVDRKKLLEATLLYPSLRAVLIQHDKVLFAEAQQSAACNAVHAVEARMCRWLLRMRDLSDGDEIPLTQEFLSHMLGVRRSTVSAVASALQKAGYISYSRGNVRILNIEGLHADCCECYDAVKANYTALAQFRSNA